MRRSAIFVPSFVGLYPGGVSETDAGTRDMERKRVYKELFPDRMMKDYIKTGKGGISFIGTDSRTE